MNQLDNEDRLSEINSAISQQLPIGASIVYNANGTSDISIPPPTKRTLELYREAVVLYPDNVDLHLNFSFALLQSGDRQSARAQVQEAVRIGPSNYSAHSSLASCLLNEGEVDAAIQEYRQALILYKQATPSPSQSEVTLRWGLAEALERSGARETCRTELQTAVSQQRELVSKQRGSEQLLQQLETKLLELP